MTLDNIRANGVRSRRKEACRKGLAAVPQLVAQPGGLHRLPPRGAPSRRTTHSAEEHLQSLP